MTQQPYVVIMAGGRGTRFWPLSRKVKAKQFLRLINGKSFLEHTISRLNGFVSLDRIIIVGNQDQAPYLFDNAAGVKEENILLEPCGRNTAPCIGWAAKEILKRDKNAVMLVLPADHMITPTPEFQACMTRGMAYLSGHPETLLTVGISPSSPHTGYGYIQAKNQSLDVSEVVQFKEKPDLNTAIAYLESGSYYWNAGIFMWKASVFMQLLETHLPDLYAGLQADDVRENYADLPSVSVDYGIMEKVGSQIRVLKATFNWNDIGSWEAIRGFWSTDENENASDSNVIALNSTGNTVYSKDKLVALLDVDDVIVVDSKDALLIAKRSSDQKIKKLVDILPDVYL